MTEFVTEAIFSNRILKTEFTEDSPLAPVRKLARKIFGQTAANSNHKPLISDLLPGEREAADETAQRLDLEAARLTRSWSDFTPEEKLEKTSYMAYQHLIALGQHLEDLIPNENNIPYHFWSPAMVAITHLGYVETGKAVSLTHLPPGDDIGKYPENYVSILKYGGKSAIDTFEEAVKISLYLAARLHQTRLALLSEETELPDQLKQAARLFQLTEDLTPYVCYNGSFIWDIDEFEQWMSQPKYRHAFAYVTAVMREYKLDPHYALDAEFTDSWKIEFYNEYLDRALMGKDVAFYSEKT